jgi:2'-5' RNA ligase
VQTHLTGGDIPTFASTWEAFLARDELVLAEDVSDWARGRAQSLGFSTRVEGASAREYIAGVIERIADIPGVEVFPDWYWHITIKGAGFQVIKRTHDDDVLREDVPKLAGRAKAIFDGTTAFDVQLGPASAFPEAVILEVHDEGAVRALNTHLLEEVDGIGRYPFDGATFLPHVSVARFTSGEGLAALKERLGELRNDGAGPRFQVRRIELVKVWVSEDLPEIETLATYALASPGAAR